MASHGTRSRLERLEQLRGLLKSRDHVTAAELGEELGVSLRTVRRDLEILRDAGLPIEADRGRGGGLRLHRSWSLGRLQLSPAEAIDVLLSLAIAERMGSPILLQQLSAVRRKIVAAFGEAHQPAIRALRTRILMGKPASSRVLSTYMKAPRRPVSSIVDAFVGMHCVTFDYVDGRGIVTTREIEPQFLYLSVPVWYVLAWDRLRGGVRYFRIDRMESVRALPDKFRLRDPRPFLAEAERGIERL